MFVCKHQHSSHALASFPFTAGAAAGEVAALSTRVGAVLIGVGGGFEDASPGVESSTVASKPKPTLTKCCLPACVGGMAMGITTGFNRLDSCAQPPSTGTARTNDAGVFQAPRVSHSTNAAATRPIS
jgi:hypothetical protein